MRDAMSPVPDAFHFGIALPIPLIASNIPVQFAIHEPLIQYPEFEFTNQLVTWRR